MSQFNVEFHRSHGRKGNFTFGDGILTIQTPCLFPVVSFMTGTTARGGGFWKYILQYDREHGLMRRNLPLLSQVLHFLDYKSVSPKALENWRSKSIRGFYNGEAQLELSYQAPLFFDSGGFKLMWRNGLDLKEFGIDLHADREAASVLELQLDLGGNIVASLDYPLPPTILPNEANERMIRSRQNAIRAALLLDAKFGNSPQRPFLYMAAHGLTPESITGYINTLFYEMQEQQLFNQSLGVAIGSLVPFRTADKIHALMKIVLAATKAIPVDYQSQIPVHVFGVTGILIPFLAYCGIDTFDSSTYAQEAKSMGYLDPTTRSSRSVLEMQQRDIHCQCPICQNLNLREMQNYLVVDTKSKPLPNGHYKSKYYADIGFHNLSLDLDILYETQRAIEEDSLDEYLIETARRFPRSKFALQAICEADTLLNQKATRSLQFLPVKATPNGHTKEAPQYKTLTHTPDDFDLAAVSDYLIPEQQKILLLIPCSAEKPYSASYSHQFVKKNLDEYVPEWREYVHKVSLSGLYGPVPERYECLPALMEYDFRLIVESKKQIEMCTSRLLNYLERHKLHYTSCVAYATSKAYRTVFLRVAQQYPSLYVLPLKPKAQKSTEFFRSENIQELAKFIGHAISECSPSDTQSESEALNELGCS